MLIHTRNKQIYTVSILIGHFPLFIKKARVKDIIEGLIECTRISDDTLKWAESRKEALHSLTMIIQTLNINEAGGYVQ